MEAPIRQGMRIEIGGAHLASMTDPIDGDGLAPCVRVRRHFLETVCGMRLALSLPSPSPRRLQTMIRIPSSIKLSSRLFSCLVLLAASCLVNIGLAQRLTRFQSPSVRGPKIGDLVPDLVGATLEGRQSRTDFGGSVPTVLYYFSPTCVWCEKNWSNVGALVSGTEGRYRVIGLATQAPDAAFIRDRHIAFPILTGFSKQTLQSFGLGGTPQTLVISPEHRVLKTWSGAFVSRQAKTVERFFDVQLPPAVQDSRQR
jgi:peroxiredoxin